MDNAEDLYLKVQQAMSLSEDEKKTIEDNAFERVKNLTPENVYEKMMEVYSKLLL